MRIKNSLRRILGLGIVQLQHQKDDGSWQDVQNESLPGKYRTVKLVKGIHTFSDVYEVS